jgi:cyclophilin family peptidyl-prolyl cis-trans isomerase
MNFNVMKTISLSLCGLIGIFFNTPTLGQVTDLSLLPEAKVQNPKIEEPKTKEATQGSNKTNFQAFKPLDPRKWEVGSQHLLVKFKVRYGQTEYLVVAELYPQHAPNTVANFVKACQAGEYQGVLFHRAINDFIVQTGDPLTKDESKRAVWGTGGNEVTLASEIKRPHFYGSLGMARNQNPAKRSNSRQFYISVGNMAALDSEYTVFGQVVAGMSVIKKISQTAVDANDTPLGRVELVSAEIVNHTGPYQPPVNNLSANTTASQGRFAKFWDRVW